MMPKMDGVRISSCVRPGQKDAMADEIETHYFIQRVLDQCSDRNSDRIKRWFDDSTRHVDWRSQLFHVYFLEGAVSGVSRNQKAVMIIIGSDYKRATCVQ